MVRCLGQEVDLCGACGGTGRADGYSRLGGVLLGRESARCTACGGSGESGGANHVGRSDPAWSAGIGTRADRGAADL